MQWCTNHPEVIQNIQKCSVCGKMFCPDCLVELKGAQCCAGCKTERVKDVQSGYDAATLELASPWARLGAVMLDGIIVVMPLVIIVVVGAFAVAGFAGGGGRKGSAAIFIVAIVAALLLMFVIPVIYEALMLASSGQTLGKKIVGIRVVTADGGKISTGQAWGRTLLRFVMNMLPYSVGTLIDVLPIFGAERTCIHDMAAKTRVINVR